MSGKLNFFQPNSTIHSNSMGNKIFAFIFLCFSTLLMISCGSSTSPEIGFFLDDNGITIVCPGVTPGEKGIANGIEYEAVDEEILRERVGLESDLSALCTTPVKSMEALFASRTTFIQDIGYWDTSNVTTMEYMFAEAESFNQDIGAWNTGNVTNMLGMFVMAASFNQDLSDWCVENIPDEPGAFDLDATSWTLPRPSWGESCGAS